MKGKKITSVDPMVGALGFLSSYTKALSDPQGAFEKNRATAVRDKVGDITIDTCIPSDTGIWETGIRRESVEDGWVIVSQYETEEEAIVAHSNWVNLMRTDPTCELKDIDMWNLGIGDG